MSGVLDDLLNGLLNAAGAAAADRSEAAAERSEALADHCGVLAGVVKPCV